MPIRVLILLLVQLLLAPVASAAEAMVHGIQAPAWVQSTDRTVVARPGLVLRPGDTLRTGAGGRFELDLADGSRFQVGEMANIGFESLAMAQDEQGEFLDSLINVAKGAFRFTTRLLGGERRRSLRIRTGSATIGIRGTDVWGIVAEDGRAMMVLLEGSVTVDMPNEQMSVSTPMMAMLIQGEQHQEQMATVEQMIPLAAQTDMRADSAMMMMEGQWAIVLTSVRDISAAQGMALTLARAGYPANIRTVELDSGTYHRVTVESLMDSTQAQMMADEIEERLGFGDAWIMRP
jgi:hypothetical protein